MYCIVWYGTVRYGMYVCMYVCMVCRFAQLCCATCSGEWSGRICSLGSKLKRKKIGISSHGDCPWQLAHAAHHVGADGQEHAVSGLGGQSDHSPHRHGTEHEPGSVAHAGDIATAKQSIISHGSGNDPGTSACGLPVAHS